MSDKYYDLPISEQTREGMTLNINDLGALGRMLSLQDDVYEEHFEKLTDIMNDQKDMMKSIIAAIADVKNDIVELREEIGDIRSDVCSLAVRISKVEEEVEQVKRILKKKGVL